MLKGFGLEEEAKKRMKVPNTKLGRSKPKEIKGLGFQDQKLKVSDTKIGRSKPVEIKGLGLKPVVYAMTNAQAKLLFK